MNAVCENETTPDKCGMLDSMLILNKLKVKSFKSESTTTRNSKSSALTPGLLLDPSVPAPHSCALVVMGARLPAGLG